MMYGYKKVICSLILKENSRLYYIEYLDHGISPDNLEEIRKKPLTLWVTGFIVNEEENEEDEYYAIVSEGSRFRDKKPIAYVYVIKHCITKMKVIHTIKNNE